MPLAYSYIRMSSDAQIKGDSLRRQLDLSERYAFEHGLELVDTDLRDLGVSAFTGENAYSGALSKFLAAVRQKAIPVGSYLLVESFDRLSRQRPHAALTQFLEIINAGIILVTLVDGRVYTPDNATLDNLLYAIVVMTRAHEESVTKSHRVSAAWKNKRQTIAMRKLTARCPAWLVLAADKSAFTIREDRKAIIERMFDEANAGIGAYSIARRLNVEGIPAFVGKGGWHTSSINKILTNRAVLGEFQPHRLIDGQRKPEGLPIPGYFPRIISEDAFYSAQLQRSQRRTDGGGRRGPAITNLFSKLARCHYCRGPMRFENKGTGPKGGSYLVCDTAVRFKSCRAVRWNYREFEASFLAFVEEVDLGSFITSGDTASPQVPNFRTKVASLEGKIESLKTEQQNAYALLQSAGANLSYVRQRLVACEIEITESEKELGAILSQQTMASQASRTYDASKIDLRGLILQIGSQLGPDTYKLRSQLAMRLRSILTSLTLSPAGGLPLATWDHAKRVPDDPSFNVDLYMSLDDPHQGRYFVACFRDGSFRVVFPAKDALAFHQQIIREKHDFYLVEGDAGLTDLIDLDLYQHGSDIVF